MIYKSTGRFSELRQAVWTYHSLQRDVVLSKLQLKALFHGRAVTGNQTWAATHLLGQAGAELYRLRGGGPVRKLHHKLAVIDGQVIIAGSFNYTSPANALNDENVLVLGKVNEPDPEAKRGQRKLARAALREIGRIVREYGEGL